MSTYFLTGGSGFIGGHLAEELTARGHNVRCLVRKTSNRELLESVGVQYVEGSLADFNVLAEAVEEVDYVVHLAGRTSAFKLDQLMAANRDGTFNLARACAQATSPPVHVVISSIAASGPTAHGTVRMEGASTAPVSNYGLSKRAGECAAQLFADRVPTTIVRPGIVFGPRNTEMLPVFKSVSNMNVHAIMGVAAPRISLIHVADLVEIIIRAAEHGQRLTTDNLNSSGTGIYYGVCPEYPTYASMGKIMKHAINRGRGRLSFVPSPLSWTVGIIMECMARIRGQQLSVNLDKIREAHASSWACSTENLEHLGMIFPASLLERFAQTGTWYRENNWL